MILRTIILTFILVLLGILPVKAANVFLDTEFWKTANLDKVNMAIHEGADIHAKSSDGTTPLMLAAKYNGNPALLALLIKKHNADVAAINNNGDTALSLLSTTEVPAESVQLLLENGAQKNPDHVILAYNNAVNGGAPASVVELLLMHSGTDNEKSEAASISNAPLPITVPTPASTQVLGDATSNPLLSQEFWKDATKDKVQELLAKGHDINTRDAKGKSPLMLASSLNKDAEVIEALLEKGAKVQDKDAQDWNALMHAAASNGHSDVVNTLINYGADVNSRDKAQWTPLMAAITLNPNEGIVDALLARGALVNAQEMEGKTALMLGAVNNQNPKNINTLLNNGADFHSKDTHNKTALDYAKENTSLSKTGILHRLQ